MKNRTKWLTGVLATAGLAPALLTDRAAAQVPAAPPAPAVAPVAAPGAPGDLGVPPPGGLLGNCIKAKAYCRAKLCASPLGQLLNNALKPATLFSGGIIPPLCPPNAPNPADLAMRPDSPQGAAAAIKADTAGAAARRAAVRYLGTVDCHYWPEAQLALANALRTDRNYCVRREAAYALLNGCCCTRITVEALSIAVSGSDRDGNPSETDEQVKSVAMMALQHCLDCLGAVTPQSLPLTTPPPTRPIERVPNPRERVPEPTPTSKNDSSKPADKIVPVAAHTTTRTRVTPAEYYKHIEETSWADIVANARKTLAKARQTTTASSMQAARESPGLIQLLSRSITGPTTEEYTVETPAPRLATPSPIVMAPPVANTASATRMPTVVNTAPSPATITVQPTDSPFHAHVTANVGFDSGPAAVLQQPVPTAVQPKVTMTWHPVSAVPAPAPARPVAAAPAVIGINATPAGQVQAAAAAIHETQVAPVSFQMPAPAVKAPPAKAAPSVASAPGTMSEQWIIMLRTHADPGHRVWAADNLARMDGWTNHVAVEALVRGAREDRDVTVRLACIRDLAHMQVTNQLVIGTIQDLHADPNPTIQQAARSALGQLCSLPGPDEMQSAH